MYNITRSKLIRAASVDMGDIYEHGDNNSQQQTTLFIEQTLLSTISRNYHAVNIQYNMYNNLC